MRRRTLLAAAALPFVHLDALAQSSARFAAAAAYSAQQGGAGLIVARNGVVLGEDYPGSDGPDSILDLGEATRVLAPLLAASLVKDGMMSLDEPASMTLTPWVFDPAKSTISVRRLLAGDSGIVFGARINDPIAQALDLPPQAAPGERFSDDAAPFAVLAEITRRKLINAGRSGDAADYLSARTLRPIGCSLISWRRGADGAPRFDDGAAISLRALAQIGELMRREGVWRAQQLVDAETVREARRGNPVESRAGIGLWLTNGVRTPDGLDFRSDLWRMNPPAPIDLAMAAGRRGQRLYIIPSENLVVARMPSARATADWSDARFLSLLSGGL